jgi:hypothetical protein
MLATASVPYLGSLFLVLLFSIFSHHIIEAPERLDFITSLSQWDGQHYRQIAERGYTYVPGEQSEVAFFPAYPVLVRATATLMHLSIPSAQILVSNMCVFVAIAFFCAYCRTVRVNEIGVNSEAVQHRPFLPYAVASFALWPPTFFWRMGYSESLFVAMTLATMLALCRGKRFWVVALLAGFTTAIRPVGVALLLPISYEIVQRSVSWREAIRRAFVIIPASCWGLIAYMCFLGNAFGEPLSFVTVQNEWRLRSTGGVWDKTCALMSWEPFWSVYASTSPAYWRRFGPPSNPLISLQFANPIYFLCAIVLISIGAYKHWLRVPEVLLSIGLVTIPYVTKSYEMCMGSHARFASVVFPAYIVGGILLSRVPSVLAVTLVAMFGGMLGIYTALFVAGYLIF